MYLYKPYNTTKRTNSLYFNNLIVIGKYSEKTLAQVIYGLIRGLAYSVISVQVSVKQSGVMYQTIPFQKLNLVISYIPDNRSVYYNYGNIQAALESKKIFSPQRFYLAKDR